VSRHFRRRPARGRAAARLRGEDPLRRALAEEDRRAEEGLRARPPRRAQPHPRRGGAAEERQEESDGEAMSDAELVERFERADVAKFHHPDHVRVAFAYLRVMPLLDAIGRFTAALRRFAAAQGKPRLYHETITWAFLFIIHER